jgi:hypothetical protein
MEEAARRAGREAGAVRLVAVAKTRTAEEIREVLGAGVEDIGENRLQEAEEKHRALAGEPIHWHLVGHLQANKAKRALGLFQLIHSVDSPKLAERLDRLAAEAGKLQRVLIQVDLAGESTKFGLPEAELLPALEEMARLAHLEVAGLMLMPPLLEPEAVRPFFARLRELSESARARGLLAGSELSMGMSHDFEVAIEEGATLVRIGTAIFGERPAEAEAEQDGAPAGSAR